MNKITIYIFKCACYAITNNIIMYLDEQRTIVRTHIYLRTYVPTWLLVDITSSNHYYLSHIIYNQNVINNFSDKIYQIRDKNI